MIVQWQDLILSSGILLSGFQLIWVDLKKLEIEIKTLALMFVIVFIQRYIHVGMQETIIHLFAGIMFWLILTLSRNRIPRFGQFGTGDPLLIGVIAFMTSPMLLVWAILSSMFILAISGFYSIRRGKKLFRSIFPAAPPLVTAGLIIYFLN